MESRAENLEVMKEKVMDFIETHGPSLPIRIASQLRSDSLIVGAFLSELLGEKKLYLSSMKVGSSPLYYLRGQEFQLENFAQYLSSGEQKAFELLKTQGVLMDEKMYPTIRVALRSIKDFAFPFEHKGKLYWRFIKLQQERAIEMIGNKQKEGGSVLQKIKQAVLPREIQKPLIEETQEQLVEETQKPLVERGIQTDFQNGPLKKSGVEVEKRKIEFIHEEKPKRENKKEEVFQNENQNVSAVQLEEKQIHKIDSFGEKPLLKLKSVKEIRIKEKSDFVFDVIDFLEKKEFIIADELEYKKKEYYATVKVDTALGKVNFYCIAKDKKSVTENDLNQALQFSQEHKRPVLLISPGEPNKKAVARLEEIGNLVFYLRLG
ncbi:MAG: hypothetical protein U9Q06_03660 [Nanoarchaeota archaeon]|nr:hypothetical protein [Nanoarchaeota archaeon]